MAKVKSRYVKLRDTVGGYPSGDRLITDLEPPPPGPAPGAKARPTNEEPGLGDSGDSASDTK